MDLFRRALRCLWGMCLILWELLYSPLRWLYDHIPRPHDASCNISNDSQDIPMPGSPDESLQNVHDQDLRAAVAPIINQDIGTVSMVADPSKTAEEPLPRATSSTRRLDRNSMNLISPNPGLTPNNSRASNQGDQSALTSAARKVRCFLDVPSHISSQASGLSNAHDDDDSIVPAISIPERVQIRPGINHLDLPLATCDVRSQKSWELEDEKCFTRHEDLNMDEDEFRVSARVFPRAGGNDCTRISSTSRESRERLPYHNEKARKSGILPQYVVREHVEQANAVAAATRRDSTPHQIPDLPFHNETSLRQKFTEQIPLTEVKPRVIPNTSHQDIEIDIDTSGVWLPANLILEKSSSSPDCNENTLVPQFNKAEDHAETAGKQ